MIFSFLVSEPTPDDHCSLEMNLIFHNEKFCPRRPFPPDLPLNHTASNWIKNASWSPILLLHTPSTLDLPQGNITALNWISALGVCTNTRLMPSPMHFVLTESDYILRLRIALRGWLPGLCRLAIAHLSCLPSDCIPWPCQHINSSFVPSHCGTLLNALLARTYWSRHHDSLSLVSHFCWMLLDLLLVCIHWSRQHIILSFAPSPWILLNALLARTHRSRHHISLFLASSLYWMLLDLLIARINWSCHHISLFSVSSSCWLLAQLLPSTHWSHKHIFLSFVFSTSRILLDPLLACIHRSRHHNNLSFVSSYCWMLLEPLNALLARTHWPRHHISLFLVSSFYWMLPDLLLARINWSCHHISLFFVSSSCWSLAQLLPSIHWSHNHIFLSFVFSFCRMLLDPLLTCIHRSRHHNNLSFVSSHCWMLLEPLDQLLAFNHWSRHHIILSFASISISSLLSVYYFQLLMHYGATPYRGLYLGGNCSVFILTSSTNTGSLQCSGVTSEINIPTPLVRKETLDLAAAGLDYILLLHIIRVSNLPQQPQRFLRLKMTVEKPRWPVHSITMKPPLTTTAHTNKPSGISSNKWMHIYMGNRKRKKISKGLNFASWNCGGGFLTKGKKFEVEVFLKTNNIDLMAVSEVDISKTSFYYDELYKIKDYELTYPPSWQNIGKTRILLYMKTSLVPHIKIRPDLSPPQQPIIWVQIMTTPAIFTSFVYREWTDWTGDKSTPGQVLRLTEAFIKAKVPSSRETIWTGDFNIQEEKLSTADEADCLSTKLKDFMLEEGLEQLVKEPTRERVVNGTLQQSTIDLILSSRKENITDIKVHKMSNSDHSIVSFNRKSSEVFKPEPVTVRNFKDFDEEAFVHDVELSNWMLEGKQVDEAVSAFTTTVLGHLDKHAPWVTFTPKTKSNPLISKETVKWIKLRDKADSKAKKTKSAEDLLEWRKLRNKVVGMIAKDKKQADQLNFSSAKKAWAAFSVLKRNNNLKSGPPERIQIGKKVITDKKEMAEEFNNYFISKVEKLQRKLEEVKQPYDPVLHLKKVVPENLPEFSLKEITEEEVVDVLDGVKNTRSVGPDLIPYSVLKIAKHALKAPLATIFNISISTGTFPAAWRESTVLPLHKKLSKLELANYRNISLVSKTGLIFEKLIHKQINNHFTAHNLFSKSQNAYITGRSTATLCTSVYDRCCRAAQAGKFAGILSCDLKAGFDLIKGKILAQKMSVCYNASEQTTAWLISYMSERKQAVLVGNERSQIRPSPSSLGQGTILSPILFAIAISDLPQSVQNGDVDLFADDINDTIVDKDPMTVVVKLQEDAEAIERWLRSNQLCLAEGKTTFLLTCNKERKRDALTESLGLVMDGVAIKQSSVIRILGVLFNRDLTWTNHIHGVPEDPTETGLLQALSNTLGAVSRFPNCPIKSKRMFLTATFNSKLCYGIETWGALSEGLVRHLQCLQNRAVRLIYPTKALSMNDKLKLMNWLPVNLLTLRSSLMLLYKMKAKLICPYFEKYLYSRRTPVWERIPVYETSYGKLLGRSFLPRTILQWNLLPEQIRRLPEKQIKKGITIHLRSMMKK